MSALAPPHIVILGGGSAGWITAALLWKEWGGKGGRLTVVESSDIGIIGVGEGSTPQLKAFFDHIDVAETDWMAACDATYKLGIRFDGWSERAGFDSYFHHFPGPVDLHSEPAFINNCALARRGFDVPVLPDQYFLAAQLAIAGKSPHPGPDFPFPPSYGYHFDAYKLGAFLRQLCTSRGVLHLDRTVATVAVHPDGDVAALVSGEGTRIEGDFFIDCSGFRSMIAQETLGTKFIPFAENLFNDSAVVMPTARAATVLPQTGAAAMKAGWRWTIPLTTRTGNGYVYSSAHISDDQAETELRGALGLLDDATPARLLKMKVGRVEDSWTRNCLTVGLAQGFLEPLEATALHIVIATALDFARAYAAGGFTAEHRATFNISTANRYEGIRDYIVGHYRLNQRTDTEYWRANAANDRLSDSLKQMMTAWFTHQDMAAANAAAYGKPHYSDASWHCLFAGYGSFPAAAKMVTPPPAARASDVVAVHSMLESCARNFGCA
jgi:2-polyprenyl-6-methoxyphenol hydroxylase-like FAD-dependent oxidoreductase